jgi:hypothetical protein
MAYYTRATYSKETIERWHRAGMAHAKKLAKEQDKKESLYRVNDLVIRCLSWNDKASESGRWYLIQVIENYGTDTAECLYNMRFTDKEQANECFKRMLAECEK